MLRPVSPCTTNQAAGYKLDALSVPGQEKPHPAGERRLGCRRMRISQPLFESLEHLPRPEKLGRQNRESERNHDECRARGDDHHDSHTEHADPQHKDHYAPGLSEKGGSVPGRRILAGNRRLAFGWG